MSCFIQYNTLHSQYNLKPPYMKLAEALTQTQKSQLKRLVLIDAPEAKQRSHKIYYTEPESQPEPKWRNRDSIIRFTCTKCGKQAAGVTLSYHYAGKDHVKAGEQLCSKCLSPTRIHNLLKK